jgi:predicted nucleic acid-binding protein
LTSFVLDTSVALTWVFKDEAAPETDVLEIEAKNHGAIIPWLWYFELGNALLVAEKRNRIKKEGVKLHLEIIGMLSLTTESEMSIRSLEKIMSLARDHQLTVYDAAYLELALRHGIPLATKDKDLRAAARELKIPVLPA